MNFTAACKKIIFSAICFVALPLYISAEKITFHADSMSGSASEKSDYTKLSGNASVVTESMEISADVIELKGENFRYISATGSIKGKNTESKLDFTCDKMTYDRDTKIATLENTVHLIDAENEVSADAQLIEYDQNTQIAIMQIGVTLKQKDNTCTSAYAIYRKDAQLLDMSGNPKIVQGSNSFRAQTITLNLDTQEITLDGRVQGSVSTDDKDASKDNTSGTKTNSTTTDIKPAATTTDTKGANTSATTDTTPATVTTTTTTTTPAATSPGASSTGSASSGGFEK